MKRLLIGIAVVAVAVPSLALGAFALLPSQLDVRRSAVISASPADVQHQIAHFPDRHDWIIWTEVDPAAVYTYDGDPGALGASMHWEGQEIGTATLTLEQVIPGERVVSSLEYTAPFQMVTQDVFELEDLGDGTTRVTWMAKADLPFGPDRIFGLFADSVLGPEYEASLDNLEALMASKRS